MAAAASQPGTPPDCAACAAAHTAVQRQQQDHHHQEPAALPHMPDAWLWQLAQRLGHSSRASLRATCSAMRNAVDTSSAEFTLHNACWNDEAAAAAAAAGWVVAAAARRPQVTAARLGDWAPSAVTAALPAMLASWQQLRVLHLPAAYRQACEQLPACCPALQEMQLYASEHLGQQQGHQQDQELVACLRALQPLQQLRCLVLHVHRAPVGAGCGSALANLQQLTWLCIVEDAGAAGFGGAGSPSQTGSPRRVNAVAGGDDADGNMPWLRQLPLLQHLELPLGAGQCAPPSLSALHQLTALHLNHSVGVAGVVVGGVAPPLHAWLLQPLAGLRELRLQGWAVDAQLACALAACCPQLSALHAQQLLLPPAELPAGVSWPALRELSLAAGSGCHCTLASLAPAFTSLTLGAASKASVAESAPLEAAAAAAAATYLLQQQPQQAVDVLLALEGSSQLRRLSIATPVLSAAWASGVLPVAAQRLSQLPALGSMEMHWPDSGVGSLLLGRGGKGVEVQLAAAFLGQLTQVTSLALHNLQQLEHLGCLTQAMPQLRELQLLGCASAISTFLRGADAALERAAAAAASLPVLEHFTVDDRRVLFGGRMLAALAGSGSLRRVRLVRSCRWPGRAGAEMRYVGLLLRQAQVVEACCPGLCIEVVDPAGT